MSAAPLKLLAFDLDSKGNRSSPRSRERGPIEALTAETVLAYLKTSPRSRERGPIEAVGPDVTVIGLCASLRAHVSAAPLKLMYRVSVSIICSSPRSRERGPIEAMRLLRLWPRRRCSPRSRERGPIEATKSAAEPVRAVVLSALT